MNRFKQTMAVITAIGLLASGNMRSYAAATAASDTEVRYTETSMQDGGTADSTITGHIKVTSISVKVPVTSSFDIDPNVAVKAGDPGTTQMGGQAANYTITNLSTIPLDISITSIDTSSGVTLVQKVGDLETSDKSVLFAIREASETAPNLPGTAAGADDAKWFTKGAQTTPYKVAAEAAKNTIQAASTDASYKEDELTMKVYAATRKGWKLNDSFTVTPTFTVSMSTTP